MTTGKPEEIRKRAEELRQVLRGVVDPEVMEVVQARITELEAEAERIEIENGKRR